MAKASKAATKAATKKNTDVTTNENEEVTSKKVKHFVANEFRDINDFNKVHKEGSDVSHFDSERLKELVKNGHVVKKAL